MNSSRTLTALLLALTLIVTACGSDAGPDPDDLGSWPSRDAYLEAVDMAMERTERVFNTVPEIWNMQGTTQDKIEMYALAADILRGTRAFLGNSDAPTRFRDAEIQLRSSWTILIRYTEALTQCLIRWTPQCDDVHGEWYDAVERNRMAYDMYCARSNMAMCL